MHQQQTVAANIAFPVPVATDDLGEAFIAAWLVIGSQKRAEAAVAEGYCLSLHGGSVLLESVSAALRMGDSESNVPDPGEQLALPPELQRVLRLSTDSRHCYVLRVLAGFSREVTSRLLGLTTFAIDELVAASMQALAFESGFAARQQ